MDHTFHHIKPSIDRRLNYYVARQTQTGNLVVKVKLCSRVRGERMLTRRRRAAIAVNVWFNTLG